MPLFKSTRSVGWNHSAGMYEIRNLLRYGINAKHCMESTIGCMESFQRNVWNQERRERYTLSRGAMRGQAAIPCNSQIELMPYQALRSWINKKTNQSSSFYFGGNNWILLFLGRTRRITQYTALAVCAPVSQTQFASWSSKGFTKEKGHHKDALFLWWKQLDSNQ